MTLNKSLPRISVITVVLNRLEGFRKTYNSVIRQTYKNTEYIVIDGDSNDGTLEFIHNNTKNISYWHSEKDTGIYDAMNKGARAATGDWIIYMNSGDTFFSKDTLARLVSHIDDSIDVLYGGVESFKNDKYGYHKTYPIPFPLSWIWREIPTCHQSILVRRILQVQYPFDTSLIWCADHDFLAKLYVSNYRFKEIPLVIAKFDASSCIQRDLLTFTRERWSICRRYFGKTFEYDFHFCREYSKFFFRKHAYDKVREYIPHELILNLRKLRHIY